MMQDALDNITDLAELRAASLRLLRERDAMISDIAKRDELIAKRDDDLSRKSTRIEQLELLIRILKRQQFGARSEKFDPTQQALFDAAMAEEIAAIESEVVQLALTAGPSEVAKAQSIERAPKRQALPENLPRVEERIEPASCICGACGGDLHCIGEEISEKLDLKPIEFFVRRTIRPKLACRACETMHTPPSLPAIIERGIAAPGLLAHVLIGKYLDHLPLNRQIEMYKRNGVELSKSSLSEWVGACGFALQPLVDALRSELQKSSVIHADETPVQMLDPGRGQTKTAYLFAYRRGEINEPPIIVYDFAQSRSGINARRFLADYGGALVVDDYAGYKHLFQSTSMREIACMAHARRKFIELFDASKSTIAHEAITRIAALYEIERMAKNMTSDERHAHRQMHAKPKLQALFEWLENTRPKINNGSATAKAIDYMLRRKIAFSAYLDNGLFPIDNNPVENAIRPIALGRKNWLFAGSLQAGQRAANIMSLIQTAKANGHNPHAYLQDILTRLPTQLNSKIRELLPHTWTPLTA